MMDTPMEGKSVACALLSLLDAIDRARQEGEEIPDWLDVAEDRALVVEAAARQLVREPAMS